MTNRDSRGLGVRSANTPVVPGGSPWRAGDPDALLASEYICSR
jgi:hypothetical protein